MTDRAGRVRRRRARSSDGWLVEVLSQTPWWVTLGLAVAAVAVGAHYDAVTPGILGAVVLALEKATAGIVVACGGVGDEGQAFAKRSGIRIMDGTALVGLLLETGSWTRAPRATPRTASIATSLPSCPQCHADMVQRVSRHGPFCGCSRYPSCR